MNRWELHVADWKDCTRCDLHLTRRTICLARGSLPCDVLYVGQAPGRSEDVRGQPFVGQAGALLWSIDEQAFAERQELTRSFTNLVGCLPLRGGKESEPEHAEVQACRPRLEAEIEMLRPRLIVCVGKLAADYLSPGMKHSVRTPPGILRVEVVHPSFILFKLPIAARPLAVKRCVVTIRDALEAIC